MSLGTISLVILILAFLGIISIWPDIKSWRYIPGSGVGLLAIILLILLLSGRI